MGTPACKQRAADRLLGERFTEPPALLIVGPRATGKTTTALRHAATTVRLDRPAEAVAIHADPDSALRGLKEPVLLDERQKVPEVLGAVKRAVDADGPRDPAKLRRYFEAFASTRPASWRRRRCSKRLA